MLKQPDIFEQTIYPRLRDLPEDEGRAFRAWLFGRTCPWIHGEDFNQQDAYYPEDYTLWRAATAILRE